MRVKARGLRDVLYKAITAKTGDWPLHPSHGRLWPPSPSGLIIINITSWTPEKCEREAEEKRKNGKKRNMLFQGVSMKNKTFRAPAIPRAKNINWFIILRSDLLLLTTEGLKYMLWSVTCSFQVKDIILCNSTKHTCWYWHHARVFVNRSFVSAHLTILPFVCMDNVINPGYLFPKDPTVWT